jgi:hypothetical protein
MSRIAVSVNVRGNLSFELQQRCCGFSASCGSPNELDAGLIARKDRKLLRRHLNRL